MPTIRPLSARTGVRSYRTRVWDYLFGNTVPTRPRSTLGIEPLETRDMMATVAITLFGTGVDANGSALGDNQTDQHYALISNGGTSLMPGAARTITADGFPIGPWVGNGSDSRWIVPVAADNDGNAAAGAFDYRTTFDITGVDPSTVTVTGQWAADDAATIYLNGVSTGVTAAGFGSLSDFTLTNGFRVGINTLDFVVENGGGPTGLRVAALSGTGEQTTRVAVGGVVFNTGVNAAGVPLSDTSAPAVTGLSSTGAGLSDGGTDGTFTLTNAPAGYGGATKVLSASGNFPFPYWTGAADSAGSAWLVPAAADGQGNAPAGDYWYATTVNVTDPANLVLSGTWAADDQAAIFVNGVATGVTVSAPAFGSMTPFRLAGSYFTAGANTIEFRVTNGGSSDNPTGLRVSWDAQSPAIDPHWTVVEAPDSSLVGLTKVLPSGAYPFPNWIADDGNSRWIAPLNAAGDGSAAPGTYKFQTTIDLTGYDAATAVLSGRWSADNEGVNVYLNGVPLNLSVSGPNPGSGVEAYHGYGDLYIANGVGGAVFLPGLNTLTFEVRNDQLSSGNNAATPVGLRVDGLHLSATVPTVAVTAATDAVEGGAAGTFTLTRSGGDLSQSLTAYFVLGGTASATWDYTVTGATYDPVRQQYAVTFSAGATAVVVTLPTVDGDCPELDETVELVLSTASRYVVSAAEARKSFTVVDNDVTADMVAPGATWTDGGSSVQVANTGATWLRAEVVEPGWVRLSPVACGETGPAAENEYAADVTGLNGYDGDATWVGDAGGLTLTADGDIFDLTVGGWVSLDAGQGVGDVTAGTVDHVVAGGSVGSVTAADIADIVAGIDVSGDVISNTSVGQVRAGRDVVGTVSAETGGIGGVSAGRDIRGDVVAEDGIGYIPPGATAGSGGGTGVVEAGRDITGNITARTGNIGRVTPAALSGGSSAHPTVSYSGGVIAGRTIEGSVRAQTGAIAAVIAGADQTVFGPGSVTGTVSAALYDVTVSASGDVTGGVFAGWGLTINAAGDVTDTVLASDGNADVTAGGNVNAAIWGIRGVVVDTNGTLSGTVEAGDETVWADVEIEAGRDVSASIRASGGAYVSTFGGVGGPVAAWGDAYVSAGGDVTGGVVSRGASATIATKGGVSGSISAPYGVTIEASGSVGGLINAGDPDLDAWGTAEVTAGGAVTGSVSAAGGVEITAGGGVSAAVTTVLNAAIVSAGGAISGAVTGDHTIVEGTLVTGDIVGRTGVEARALSDLSGSLTSGGELTAWAGRDVTGTVRGVLEVQIEAGGNVSGDVWAGNQSTYANALVRSSGVVSGNVRATASAEVWGGDDITGDVVAGNGEAVAIAGGAVSGVVSSGVNQLRVWAPLGTGRAADYPGAPPGSDWLMVIVRGDPQNPVGTLIANDAVGTSLVSATADDPPAGQPGAANDDRARAKGAVDGLKQPRVPTLPKNLLENFRGWTKEEYDQRAADVTKWWGGLSDDDSESLADWWKAATDDARKQLVQDLLDAFSPTERDFQLQRRIGAPENPPAPVEPAPPEKAGPTDEQLKSWAKDVNDQAKASVAAADAKIAAYDEDWKLRNGSASIRLQNARALENSPPDVVQRHQADILRLKTEAAQLLDRLNFARGADGVPVPLTNEGKQQAAALKSEIEGLKNIASMTLEQKLRTTLQRVLDAKDANGNSKLEGEIRDAVLELLQPGNLAIMAGAMGGIGLASMTPAGPLVLGGAALFGYVMTGKAVLEIGEHVFKALGIAANARRPEDFDVAAGHIIAALKVAAGEAAPALAGVGAVKVIKGVASLKAVKAADAGGDAKNLVQRRADGKMQVNDGQPPPAPQPGPGGAAQAGAQPVPPAAFPPRRTPKRAVPEGLNEQAAKVWDELDGFFGKDVMDPFLAWARKDGYDLNEALPKLKAVLTKTLENQHQPTGSRGGRKLEQWIHLVSDSENRVHLERIFTNPSLLAIENLKLSRLLDDLEKTSELPGFISTFKRLAKTDKPDSPPGSGVKGIVAELQLAAKDGSDSKGINVEFTSPIANKEVTLSNGTKKTIKDGTDADNISKGTLWQVKVGTRSVEGLGVGGVEVWLRQAAEAVKAGTAPNGASKVGLRLDKDAAKVMGIDESGQFVREGGYKTMWDTLIKEYGSIFHIEIVKIPNP